MNKKTTALLIGLIVVVLGGGLAFAFGKGSTNQDSCQGHSSYTYMVSIRNDKVSDPNITGKRCERIMFTNYDDEIRGIAFGPHEDHVPYDGVGEKYLNKDQSFTITLNQTGKFHWHDHIHDEVEGYFTVTN